jgi:ATP sulfurylase
MSANTTALITDFPKLAELQENDLKDVLSDDRLTNAVLFTVPAVTAVMDEQEKLSKDNEELASKSHSRKEYH